MDPTPHYRVYGDHWSGNCYKVRLLLAHLALPFEWVHVDIMRGESRTPEFLARNPNGKIPVLEIDAEHCLPESGAILCYLAENTRYLPDARLERAETLRWLFFEQYSHEPFIATSRYIVRYLGSPADKRTVLEEKRAPGYAALEVMERHLARHPFLAADRYTIADIALFAYTHCAAEGGFELIRLGALEDWLQRVREQPGFVPMGPP